MRINYIPIFPLIWIILWTVQLITNFDYYMSTDNGKARIAIYGLMILIGVLLFLYFAFLSKGSKMIYRLSPKKHCPNCYAKVGDEGFCAKCGTALDLDKVKNISVCASCGENVDASGRDFCPKCGNMLKK